MKGASEHSRSHQQAVAETKAALNRVEAVKLRVQGKTLREIGAALGVHHATVAEYIKAELAAERQLGVHEREQLRDIERARLERLLARWLPIATADALDVSTEVEKEGKDGETYTKHIELPDYLAGTKAAELCIKASARLSALDGLDAPVKQEHSGTVNIEGISTLRARLAAAKARRAG